MVVGAAAASERPHVRQHPAMKRRWRLFLAITAIGVVLAVTALVTNPLRRSEGMIQTALLRDAPLGSSREMVRSVIREHGWEIADDRDLGFYDQRTHPPRVVGDKHIRAELGSYQGLPWRTYVTVFWGFDWDGKLIDVWVWKTKDAL